MTARWRVTERSDDRGEIYCYRVERDRAGGSGIEVDGYYFVEDWAEHALPRARARAEHLNRILPKK